MGIRFQRAGRARGKSRKPEKLNISFGPSANLDSESSSDSGGENLEEDVAPERMEHDLEVRLHVEGLTGFYSTVIESNHATNVAHLPTRYLAPGNIRMLRNQFRLQHPNIKVSYNYFHNVFRAKWGCLKFLAPSSHGCCDTCSGFRNAFRDSDSLQQRYDVARSYQLHLSAVAKDRCLEDYLQSCHPLTGEEAIPFAIHWDGMDQAKWRVPRWHQSRPLKRPQLKVQCVWVHGIVLDLYVAWFLISVFCSLLPASQTLHTQQALGRSRA